MPERVTQAEFARLLGVSRPYVSKLVSAGTLQLDDDGLIDPRAAVAALAAAADPVRQAQAASEADTPLMREIRAAAGVGTAPLPLDTPQAAAPGPDADADAGESYAAARTRSMRAQADRDEMELAERAGKLGKLDDVTDAAFKAGRLVQKELLMLPDRLSATLAAEIDPNKVHALLTQEVRTILDAIAQRANLATA